MTSVENIIIDQTVAILIDGNNIERSLHHLTNDSSAMLNFDVLIPKLLDNRGLSRLIYFREGVSISSKLAERLHQHYHGSVVPCHKSADIPLSIKATQIAPKVDTIVILSGDSDYVELVRHLKGDGVRVEIAAVVETTAEILKEEADFFIPITEEDCFTLKGKTARSSSNSKNSAQKSNTNKSSSRSSSNTKNTAQKSNSNTSKTSSRSSSKSTAKSNGKSTNSSNSRSSNASSSKSSSRSNAQKTSSRNTTSSKKSTPAAKGPDNGNNAQKSTSQSSGNGQNENPTNGNETKPKSRSSRGRKKSTTANS